MAAEPLPHSLQEITGDLGGPVLIVAPTAMVVEDLKAHGKIPRRAKYITHWSRLRGYRRDALLYYVWSKRTGVEDEEMDTYIHNIFTNIHYIAIP